MWELMQQWNNKHWRHISRNEEQWLFSPQHIRRVNTGSGGVHVVCTVYTSSNHCTHTPYVGVAYYKHSFTSPRVFNSKQTQSNINTDQMTLQRHMTAGVCDRLCHTQISDIKGRENQYNGA